MSVRYVRKWCLVGVLAALGANFGLHEAIAAQRSQAAAEEGMEVLTRGPVHEAFAETVTFDPVPGILVPKTPPVAIEELPPDQRPEGENVTWIPGYWAWDDERSGFLWVSGIWRALPPGRQWVPGYWGHSGQGAQWTSGYWADAKVSEVEYLPEPPATVEVGPNVAAPSADLNWLPGCWIWQQNRYAWRPGYWAAGNSDWDWVPAHYVWTPRGYVFVDGYYDYTIARRGVLFAPVYFDSGIYRQRGFSYSPTVVIRPSVFASHLFLRLGYGHYYYGDYYASNYTAGGFSPWFSFNSSRYGYDPFYAHQRWIHRQDRGWEQHIQADFQNRRDHKDARPPHTWAAQRARIATAGTQNRQEFTVAESLDELAKSKEHRMRFRPLANTERQQLVQHEQAVRQLREQRQKLEAQAADLSAAKSKSAQRFQRTRVKLPPSPIVALPPDRLGKDQAPPKRHEAPQPDLKVKPKQKEIQRGPARAPRADTPRTKRQPKVSQPAPQSKVDRPTGPPGAAPKKDKRKGKD